MISKLVSSFFSDLREFGKYILPRACLLQLLVIASVCLPLQAQTISRNYHAGNWVV